MEMGNMGPYIDATQILLYLFWGAFFYLVYWLNKESHREGFPLEADLGSASKSGLGGLPKPKTYVMPDGRTLVSPGDHEEPPLNAKRQTPYPGSGYIPDGDGMGAGVGPGAWANRADVPDAMFDGSQRLVPLRLATDFNVVSRDPDPRGKEVVGADGVAGGKIVDVWVDLSEHILRYYEFEKYTGEQAEDGTPVTGARALLPVNFTQIKKADDPVLVVSVHGRHFADVPELANPDVVTLLEEDKICGYYGGGYLYADSHRAEPAL